MAKAATVQSRAYKTSDHSFLIINFMGLVVGYPEPKLTLSGDYYRLFNKQGSS